MDKIEEFLTRSVSQVYPSKEELSDKLKSSKLRVYFGVDPTSPNIHLGTCVALFKLRQLQEMGHEVIFLVGSFTATIGDPSDKQSVRNQLSQDQVNKNFETYQTQASKILDFDKVELRQNGDWWNSMPVAEFLGILSKVTLKQVTERDLFEKRIQAGSEVWMHELMYPMLQGYDSVVLDVDLELGGTDQTFNMLMGRRLQKLYGKREKFVLSTPLIMGTNGNKMSKSENNTIDITTEPNKMYGKLMTIDDELIPIYAECCTTLPMEQVRGIIEQVSNKQNPLLLKKQLAFEITRFFHSEDLANSAQAEFENVVQHGNAPEQISDLIVSNIESGLVDLMVMANRDISRSEAKRLVDGGAVTLDGRVLTDPNERVSIHDGNVLKIGKRGFYRIKIDNK